MQRHPSCSGLLEQRVTTTSIKVCDLPTVHVLVWTVLIIRLYMQTSRPVGYAKLD